MDTKPKTTTETGQKPYSKPQLIDHGKINELTQGGLYTSSVENTTYYSTLF